MAKKLILLMLVIPLVIMISLYATTKTVSLAIDIAVTGVEVTSDKFLYFDIDNPTTSKIDYTVFPTNAQNKDVSYSVEKYNENTLAELEINDGIIKPLSTGMALVNVVTNDGGFRDSVVVEVVSNQVTGLEITNKNDLKEIYVGTKATLSVKLEPSEPANKVLEYESSNPEVLKVDDFGQITALQRGEATLTVRSSKYGVSDTTSIKVLNRDVLDISTTEISTFNNSGEITLSIDTSETYNDDSLSINAYDVNNVLVNDKFIFELEEIVSGYILKYTLNEEINVAKSFILEISISLPSGLVRNVSCIINFKTDFDFGFENDVHILYENQTDLIKIISDPTDIKLNYTINNSNSDLTVIVSGNGLLMQASKMGIYKINVEATYDEISKNHDMTIVAIPRSINIYESAVNYGLANELVFGSGNNTLALSINDEALNIFGDNISLVPYINNEETTLVKTSFNKNNKNYDIKVDGSLNSYVTFKIEFNYENYTYTYGEFKVLCVGNAENVSNYSELKQALDNKKNVVLKNNITDFPLNPILGEDYNEIPTTYDYEYYTNQGKGRPKVKVLLQVYSTIYGNGYEINAHKAIYENKIDENNLLLDGAIFRGPLDFVGIGIKSGDEVNGETSSGSGAASVKAQDNIFIGLYDDSSLNNVIIKNCNDVDDLVDLNYVGTTVEMLGDNISINYSRLSNGRTVFRAFGDASDDNRVCHIDISNSILSNGRDFIIRIGSNKFKKASTTSDNAGIDLDSLYLDESDKIPFPYNGQNNKSIQLYYESLSSDSKQKYDEKYIKTYVNLSNVALRQSGIFSIGLDSHFAGPALMGAGVYGNLNMLNHWRGLAKTSYGAKLTLDETIRIYDWKALDDVRSETLIEVTGNSDLLKSLEFNVASMVRKIASEPGYEDILYNDSHYKDYVHGGIAFFGGGYNYDVIEYGPTYLTNSYTLYGYQIGLDDVASGTFGEVLTQAAGNTDFYFLLCDRKTGAFSPVTQEELINSGQAYDFIIKK